MGHPKTTNLKKFDRLRTNCANLSPLAEREQYNIDNTLFSDWNFVPLPLSSPISMRQFLIEFLGLAGAYRGPDADGHDCTV